ncbi:MAG: hypothetical protein H0X37_15335 [Herpetosiphonaceae bacterium]|nr:hypothetical protein [Herpetosiphonaceae bacterium]
MPSWALYFPGVPGLQAAGTLDLADYSVRVTDQGGVGLPPEVLIAPGYVYQKTQTHPRIIVLTLTPRARMVHQNVSRERLARLLSPDYVRGLPMILRYTGAVRTLELPVVYASEAVPAGPDLDRSQGNPLSLRFVAYDPLWRTTTSTTLVLGSAFTLTIKYLMSRSVAGWYGNLSTLNGAVRALLPAGADTLFVGGDFSTPGAWAAKVVFTGGVPVWTAMASGLDNSVRCFAQAADGTLYAGGLFTNHVAKWNGSAWVALGTVSGWNAYCMAVDSAGVLYVGSDFAGGQVFAWTGSAFVSYTPLGSTANALVLGADGNVYAGSASSGLKMYTGTSWQACGSLTGSINALAVGLDGTIYVGGLFSLDGGTTYVNVAQWNGYALSPLALGLNNTVYALVVDPILGVLYAAGTFTKINGGINLPTSLAMWSGSAWYCLDCDLPGAETNYALACGPAVTGLQLTVGSNVTGSTLLPGGTVVALAGTAATAPVVALTGPGRVYELQNSSSGATLYFDLVLQTGEVVSLDMVAGTMTSSQRGNLLGKLLPGSAWGTFKLLPDLDNGNTLFLFADTTVTGTITWQERFWSLDGADV